MNKRRRYIINPDLIEEIIRRRNEARKKQSKEK